MRLSRSLFHKEYFESSYEKQDIQIIQRNYKILLDNAKTAIPLPSNPERILDFGCAFGAGTTFLSEQFPKAHIVGVDISEYAINKAKLSYNRENIAYYCLDLCCSDHLNVLKEKYSEFDLIFTRDTIEHITLNKQKEVLATLAKLLKENGTLIVQTPNKLNPLSYFDRTHIGLRSPNSWRRLFRIFFEETVILVKQYVPFIWRTRNKGLLELPLPCFGYSIYIFCRGQKNDQRA